MSLQWVVFGLPLPKVQYNCLFNFVRGRRDGATRRTISTIRVAHSQPHLIMQADSVSLSLTLQLLSHHESPSLLINFQNPPGPLLMNCRVTISKNCSKSHARSSNRPLSGRHCGPIHRFRDQGCETNRDSYSSRWL